MLWRFYNIVDYLKPNKVLIIYGPRQIGKTTLLKNFLTKTSFKYKLDFGEDIRIQNILTSQDFRKIVEYAKGYDLIAIDEAQEIPNIGIALKILVDQIPNIRIIATGSSSFSLAQNLGEPLTGRKNTLILYPLSQLELNKDLNKFDLNENLENYLIFGSYPEILLANSKDEKMNRLNELVGSYLLKDILSHEKLKGANVLFNLLKLLAFQIGQLVSLNELATQLKINVRTVERYIDLLQKSFVLYKLQGFSRNLRKEITSKYKYYFYDNGIRNAIISQFQDLNLRNDIGALFENFVFIERLKKQAYKNFYGQYYFWRTYNGEEIDLIENNNNKLSCYEFKYSYKKHLKAPKEWVKNYPDSNFKLIHKENYLDFIL